MEQNKPLDLNVGGNLIRYKSFKDPANVNVENFYKSPSKLIVRGMTLDWQKATIQRKLFGLGKVKEPSFSYNSKENKLIVPEKRKYSASEVNAMLDIIQNRGASIEGSNPALQKTLLRQGTKRGFDTAKFRTGYKPKMGELIFNLLLSKLKSKPKATMERVNKIIAAEQKADKEKKIEPHIFFEGLNIENVKKYLIRQGFKHEEKDGAHHFSQLDGDGKEKLMFSINTSDKKITMHDIGDEAHNALYENLKTAGVKKIELKGGDETYQKKARELADKHGITLTIDGFDHVSKQKTDSPDLSSLIASDRKTMGSKARKQEKTNSATKIESMNPKSQPVILKKTTETKERQSNLGRGK